MATDERHPSGPPVVREPLTNDTELPPKSTENKEILDQVAFQRLLAARFYDEVRKTSAVKLFAVRKKKEPQENKARRNTFLSKLKYAFNQYWISYFTFQDTTSAVKLRRVQYIRECWMVKKLLFKNNSNNYHAIDWLLPLRHKFSRCHLANNINLLVINDMFSNSVDLILFCNVLLKWNINSEPKEKQQICFLYTCFLYERAPGNVHY